MDIQTYKIESAKTDAGKNFRQDVKSQKLLHAAVGMSTETGEILDQLKKYCFQNRDLDEVNIKEELGDLMWYMAIFLRELNLDFEDILETNIKKLRSRYGTKFDEKKAKIRDLDKERKILES